MKTRVQLQVAGLVLLQSSLALCSVKGADYVAHEWGTFTSVQAADGVQLVWNPLVTSELPAFTYNGNKVASPELSLLLGKDGFASRQRLETPVVYFYSPEERSIDVTVDFPEGFVTEWYPRITAAPPAKPVDGRLGLKRLAWQQIQLLPQKGHEDLAQRLPTEKTGSHYYAARNTDSDFVRIQIPPTNGQPAKAASVETEKFLFYRGVGSFQAPLNVIQTGSDGDGVILRNDGREPLRHLFVYQHRGEEGRFLYLDRLEAGSTSNVVFHALSNLRPFSDVRPRLIAGLREALIKEGLYEREAAAMIQTWDDSWFSEPGVRVLYVLPRAWTDGVLPIRFKPSPRELVRVMVGRAELITPAMEWELMKQVVRFSEGDEPTRRRAAEATRNLGLGRFLEAAKVHLSRLLPSAAFVSTSSELLRASAGQAGEAGKSLATARAVPGEPGAKN